ncbi:Zinc finger, C3HC4 type (RING finger) [Musa troglodytarum]|uniref:RING-type E3 ubiquitin transferase n=1 Tax=Musa troglodytarum TaxID=320322 RepID=A0A9E7GM25_9LILI|nr:Zinc finger, C3HC4 type (RING finger) [Musa troglodytarum]
MEGEEGSTASALLRPAWPHAPPPRPSRLAALLGRAAGRRGPSMLVRETAALQLEERRADWAYSRPVVALDIGWNLAFAAVSVAVLGATTRERPNTPLRVWVAGYALQCVVHVLLVWAEYRRRRRRRRSSNGRQDVDEVGQGVRERVPSDSDAVDSEEDGEEGGTGSGQRGLTVVFLTFDVFFAIFCVALACVIGIALCCCLPCIIAILYALAGQEGASDADISILPRYRYVESCENEQKTTEEGVMIPILNNGGISTSERVLLQEDAVLFFVECCICLTSYEDGVELHALPCNHHFHSSCIVKWLRIHATCPLCKYNILKGNDIV